MKVDLALFDSTLESPVVADSQRHDQHTSLFLRIESEGVNGVGEIAPQARRLNGDPSLDDVIRELQAVVIPQLSRAYDREGRLPASSRISAWRAPRSQSAAAIAVVEMALIDRELRVGGRSIADAWEPIHEVSYQSVVSLLADEPWVDFRGASRLRAKVAPRRLNGAALERLSQVDLPVILDFNASARTLADVHDVVNRVRPHADIVAVEQPFPVGDLALTSQLVHTLGIEVSLDEGVRHVSDLRHIVRYRAGGLICVKPARVGGYATARTMMSLANAVGLRAYVGGFFETPYARFVHRALVRASTSEPSDVATLSRVGSEFVMHETSFGFGVRPDEEVFRRALNLFDY